jgi:hypothetical protein
MYFNCKGFCFNCNAPLNPYIKSNNYEVRELIRKYRRINPIWLYNNEMFYKFYGCKLKRVCFSCFTHVKKPSIKQLLSREIGKTKNLTVQPLSLKKEDILFWYQSLHRYVSKNFKNRQIIVYNSI